MIGWIAADTDASYRDRGPRRRAPGDQSVKAAVACGVESLVTVACDVDFLSVMVGLTLTLLPERRLSW
jgi:hypothetical protein